MGFLLLTIGPTLWIGLNPFTSALNITVSLESVFAVIDSDSSEIFDYDYEAYSQVWRYLLPLVTETVLFGSPVVTSAMFFFLIGVSAKL